MPAVISPRRALAALGAGALLTFGALDPAGADPRTHYSRSMVWASGSGLWTNVPTITFAGPGSVLDWRNGELLDATVTATLAPDDGSLPGPNTCEDASATMVFDGERNADLNLAGAGTVCARTVPIAPHIVFHQFNGIYEIVDAGRHSLRGDDGSFSISLTGGFATAFANDFIPEG